MRIQILALAMLVAVLAFAAPAQSQELVFASEEWEGATNKDGSGFYWDLIRAIYEPKGYTIKITSVPYARSVNMVKNGKAVAYVGSYIDEENFVVYPKTAFDADNVSAVTIKGAHDLSKGQAALEGKTVGWINEYGYDDYLEVSVAKETVTKRSSGLKMLQKNRIDVFLDAAADITPEIRKMGLKEADFDITSILQLKLYIAFQGDNRGKELAEMWDQRMKELHDSGKLKQLYAKSGYTNFYPFK